MLLLIIQISEHLFSGEVHHYFYHEQEIPVSDNSHTKLLDHHICHQFNIQNIENQVNTVNCFHLLYNDLYIAPSKKVVIGIWRPPKS